MQDQEAYADCAGSNLHFSRFGISEIGILRVDDKCDGRRRWYQFAKEIKPLAANFKFRVYVPVMLPPGLLRFVTKPLSTGSEPIEKTNGIDFVAVLAATSVIVVLIMRTAT